MEIVADIPFSKDEDELDEILLGPTRIERDKVVGR